MQDLRYLNDKDKFLNYAYDVLKDYFTSRDNFNYFFINLSDNNTKNNFLKIISFYKFLVRDSSLISLIKDETDPERSTQQVISYLDETYKFIGIFALIEGLIEVDNYEDFYNWLLAENDFKSNPIKSKSNLRDLYSKYLKIHSSTFKAIKFFKTLDDDTKNILTSKIKIPRVTDEIAIETIANFLYDLRSEFVHNCRLILETSKGKVLSTVDGDFTITELDLNDLKVIFERGFLIHFGFSFSKKAENA